MDGSIKNLDCLPALLRREQAGGHSPL